MNIKQAKEYIKNSVSLYLKKDEFGEYRVPVVRQRPIFLLGAPGIGKTAIMEQIAQELGIALVAYSMTHHTRQSALGLPFIEKKTYGGREYPVSEYTMSEIIASIYDTMEESGIKEGILFLDEINCATPWNAAIYSRKQLRSGTSFPARKHHHPRSMRLLQDLLDPSSASSADGAARDARQSPSTRKRSEHPKWI